MGKSSAETGRVLNSFFDSSGRGGNWGTWGGKDGVVVQSFTLKYAKAADVAVALDKIRPAGLKFVAAEAETNRLLLITDASTSKDVIKFLEEPRCQGHDARGY